jgi:hypothetical protein
MLGELIYLAERAYKPTPEPDTDNTGVGIFLLMHSFIQVV